MTLHGMCVIRICSDILFWPELSTNNEMKHACISQFCLAKRMAMAGFGGGQATSGLSQPTGLDWMAVTDQRYRGSRLKQLDLDDRLVVVQSAAELRVRLWRENSSSTLGCVWPRRDEEPYHTSGGIV
jgi:hypothetical protein